MAVLNMTMCVSETSLSGKCFIQQASIINIGSAETIYGWILCFHPLENPYAFDGHRNYNVWSFF